MIRTAAPPLWRAMARIQSRVAREYNRKLGVYGPLWQSRYKARVVLDQADIRNLIAYVHLNPVTACVVTDPSGYRLCGHSAVMGFEPPRLTNPDSTLPAYDEDTQRGRQLYQQHLRGVAECRWRHRRVRDLPWWRGLEDNELTLQNTVPTAGAAGYLGQPLPPEEPHRPPLDVVLQYFEDSSEIPRGRLAGGSRTRLDGWYRCQFSTFAVSWLDFQVHEVASLLGKARGSVSRWLAEGLQLQSTDRGFRDNLLELRCGLGASVRTSKADDPHDERTS